MQLKVQGPNIWCDNMKNIVLMYCEKIGRLFPRVKCKKMEKLLKSTGLEIGGEAFLGVLTIVALILSFFISLALLIHPTSRELIVPIFPIIINYVLTLFVVFLFLFSALVILTWTFNYIFSKALLLLIAEERTREMENVLADFLTLISANVRSGMPLDQAMWHAARPEFGILSKEVKWYIKQAFSGEPLDETLRELSLRFDSKLFKRTISLIRQAEQTGGEVGSVLDMTAQEVRRELTTRKEISAMLVTYEIFVLFAAVVGTPFLFSVVCKLLTILEKSFSYIPTTNQRFFGFIHPGSIIVSSQDFTLFSCFIIIITTLSSAAIISIIKHTRKTQAIKYFPFMLIAALGIFFLTGYILDSFMARFV